MQLSVRAKKRARRQHFLTRILNDPKEIQSGFAANLAEMYLDKTKNLKSMPKQHLNHMYDLK